MKIKNQILGLCLICVFMLFTGCGLLNDSGSNEMEMPDSISLDRSAVNEDITNEIVAQISLSKDGSPLQIENYRIETNDSNFEIVDKSGEMYLQTTKALSFEDRTNYLIDLNVYSKNDNSMNSYKEYFTIDVLNTNKNDRNNGKSIEIIDTYKWEEIFDEFNSDVFTNNVYAYNGSLNSFTLTITFSSALIIRSLGKNEKLTTDYNGDLKNYVVNEFSGITNDNFQISPPITINSKESIHFNVISLQSNWLRHFRSMGDKVNFNCTGSEYSYFLDVNSIIYEVIMCSDSKYPQKELEKLLQDTLLIY